MPILLLVFSLVIWRITLDKPKELYNYARSEKYFAKGGLRDLIKIPVTLVVFIHDTVVWIIWGLYQIIVLFADAVFFVKELFFALIKGLIWFFKQLFPFWRLIYKLFVFYLLKWPWWIYRYAFRNIRKTYNWNIIRVSSIGSFIALAIFQLFYFFDFVFEIEGLVYIGLVLAILPISWIFGEVSSIRGQKLLFASFKQVKSNFRNGLEVIRSLLFFLTFFVLLVLVQAGLDMLGWIPKSGIIFLGIGLNINFIINIILLFLIIVIVFGSFVIPTYRLFNDFNETSFRNIFSLLSYIVRRFLQIISGIIPSTFFAAITIVFPVILVSISLALTLGLKYSVINMKIKHAEKEILINENQEQQLKLRGEIEYLKYIQQFPTMLVKEMENRQLIENEINNLKKELNEEKISLARFKEKNSQQLYELKSLKEAEQKKPVINQTRVDELTASINSLSINEKQVEQSKNNKIEEVNINIGFAEKKYSQLPFIFYLSGLFMVFVSTLVFAFFWAYFGNFFYNMYKFRNDGTHAVWKDYIQDEQLLDNKQPLLSVTLNIVLILAIAGFFFYEKLIVFFANLY